MEEWEELMRVLEGVTLERGIEVLFWKLEKNGKYSAKSVYKELTFRGVRDQRLMEIW